MLLKVAKVGHAHWFFGNVYEAVVRVPHRLASDRSTSVLGSGSPVRYYLPGTPATFPAAVAALVSGRNNRESRMWLLGGAACSLSAAAATAYIVRAVNVKLFFSTQQLSAEEQKALLRTWYRVNAFRIIASGGAWLALRWAQSRLGEDRSGR